MSTAEEEAVMAASEGEDQSQSQDQEKQQTKKTPVPEGYMAPVEFAKHLSERFGEDIRPQVIYGYIRNGKEFPVEERDGTPKFIVNVDAATEWVEERRRKRKEREAKKQQEADEA